MIKNRNDRYLLPFHLISAARSGDLTALSLILNHYDGYIKKLATRHITDETGRNKKCLDSELYGRLKIRLITRTLAFNVN